MSDVEEDYGTLSDVCDDEYPDKSDSEESGEEGGSDEEEGITNNDAICCKTQGCTRPMSCEYEARCSRQGCLMCRGHCKCIELNRLYSSKSEEWRGMRQTTLGMSLQQQLHTQIQTPNERMFYVFIFGPNEEIEEIEDVNLLDLDYENPTDAQLEVYNRQR